MVFLMIIPTLLAVFKAISINNNIQIRKNRTYLHLVHMGIIDLPKRNWNYFKGENKQTKNMIYMNPPTEASG